MSTVAIRNTMVMNNTEKKVSLVERFKNGYAAGQIMRDARCVAAANR